MRAITIAFILMISPVAALSLSNDQRQHELKMFNLPELQTLDEVMTFFTNCTNVANARIPTSGSSYFPIVLSCGPTTDNWHVESLASLIFAPFGKECIPRLIELLDDDALYVRYGAYELLQQKAGRYDNNYDFHLNNREARRPGVEAWRKWWSVNENNPRLDNPPKRVYEAGKWDKEQ